jgi:hypothetical protein
MTGPHADVIAALAAVQAEIGGIEKLSVEERRRRGTVVGDTGVSYAYRGIDQIAAAAQPLLGLAGVVIVPTVTARTITEITVNNKPWSDTLLTVEWRIYGPGGVTDMITATTEGWGRDNSDKGINKAMTGAFKNVLLRLLCIGDPQDDTDGHTHERSTPDPGFDWPAIGWEAQAEHDAERARVRTAISSVPAEVRLVLLEEWESVAAEVISQEAADPPPCGQAAERTADPTNPAADFEGGGSCPTK